MSHSIEQLIDTLYQQIETLAEESKKTFDTETKIRIAGEIDRIAETIIRIDADQTSIIVQKGVGWNGRVSEGKF